MAESAALFVTLFMLALMPTSSGLLVVSHTLSRGLPHGLLTALGIAVGDILFILIAIYGLALLADFMAGHFTYIKLIGGAYLLWLGFVLWRSKPTLAPNDAVATRSHMTSFMAGLLITLADQKAILFYLGLFPVFYDLHQLTPGGAALIVVLAGLAVGIPKAGYAILAHRLSQRFDKSRLPRIMNRLAGGILMVLGMLLLLKQ